MAKKKDQINGITAKGTSIYQHSTNFVEGSNRIALIFEHFSSRESTWKGEHCGKNRRIQLRNPKKKHLPIISIGNVCVCVFFLSVRANSQILYVPMSFDFGFFEFRKFFAIGRKSFSLKKKKTVGVILKMS